MPASPDGTVAADTSHPMRPPRIDVHAHFLPPEYARQARDAGHERPDGMPGLPAWSPELALDTMERLNIRTAILSISSPGIHFGDGAAAIRLARIVNEAGARAMGDHPGRFGLFASVPLPDVDSALAEAAYALDVLGADGVTISSNHDGVYPGDPRLDPFLAEMNRRQAAVFLHPTAPRASGAGALSLGYPAPVLEYMFDSTRALANLLLRRTLVRFPDIRLIVSHAGTAMPVLVDRIIGMLPAIELDDPVTPEDILATLRGIRYDLAGYPFPRLAPALLQFARPDHLFYGSDWPFVPVAKATRLADVVDTTPVLDAALREAVLSGNAASFFPRFSSPGAERPGQ